MTDKQVMQMALEALRVATKTLAPDREEVLKAYQALRTALAQPEQNDKRFVNGGLPMGGMGFKVVNEVAQSEPYADRKREIELFSNGRINVDAVTGDIGIGTIAQPEQEPFAYVEVEDVKIPLYTAPPKREWVGLTDEEISTIDWKHNETLHDYARAIEAKLKEKNHDSYT